MREEGTCVVCVSCKSEVVFILPHIQQHLHHFLRSQQEGRRQTRESIHVHVECKCCCARTGSNLRKAFSFSVSMPCIGVIVHRLQAV